MRTYRDKLVDGLLAAYAVTVVCGFAGGCVYATLLTGGWSLHHAESIPIGAIFGFAGVAALATAWIAAIAACVLALPLFAFLLGRGVASSTTYVAAGALLGGVLATIFAAAHSMAGFLVVPEFWFWLLIVIVSGLLSGTMFWVAAVRNPSTQ